MLRVELDEGAGIGLRRHHESEILVQEYRHQQWRRVVGVDRAVVDELTNAHAVDHDVVVPLDQFRLIHQIAGFGVIPTGLRVIFPADQSGGPGQFEDSGRRQFVVDLHLEAGARGTVRAQLGATDDDNQIGRVDVEVIPVRGRCWGESARRGRQRGNRSRSPRAPSIVIGSVSCGLGRMILARFVGQFGHVEVGITQPTGEVGLDGLTGRGHLGLHIAQVEQHCRHLVGGVGGDTGLLDRADDGVVVTHQPGAAGPADQRVRQADPAGP